MRLVDWQIASLQKRTHVIDPYEAALVRETPTGTALAYGQARDGYVLRLSATSALSNYLLVGTLDPKRPPKATDVHGLSFIPPTTCLMALTVESVRVPRGYIGRLELIPEYEVCGLHLATHDLLGGAHEGRVLISLVNTMSIPVWLYHGEGVAKLVLSEAPFPSRAEEQEGPYRAGAALALPGGASSA